MPKSYLHNGAYWVRRDRARQRADSLAQLEKDVQLASTNLLHIWMQDPPYADRFNARHVIRAELLRREAWEFVEDVLPFPTEAEMLRLAQAR